MARTPEERAKRTAYMRGWCAKNKARLDAERHKPENMEKDRANTERWRSAHREQSRAVFRDWYRRKGKDYYEKNKQKLLKRQMAHNRRRRAHLKGSSGRHTDSDIALLFRKQRGKCANCKKKISENSGVNKFQIDHVEPLVRGGSDNPDNLQLLCKSCNSKKHAKTPEEWAKQTGRLFC